MNKFMNLIGVKARNALKIKIDTNIKNKELRIDIFNIELNIKW